MGPAHPKCGELAPRCAAILDVAELLLSLAEERKGKFSSSRVGHTPQELGETKNSWKRGTSWLRLHQTDLNMTARRMRMLFVIAGYVKKQGLSDQWGDSQLFLLPSDGPKISYCRLKKWSMTRSQGVFVVCTELQNMSVPLFDLNLFLLTMLHFRCRAAG